MHAVEYAQFIFGILLLDIQTPYPDEPHPAQGSTLPLRPMREGILFQDQIDPAHERSPPED